VAGGVGREGLVPDVAGLAPSAVEYDLARGELGVLVEGSPVGVAARVRSLRRVLRDAYPDADVVVAQEPPPWWGRYPFGDGDVGLRIAAPVGLVPALLTELHDHLGGVVAVRGSIGSGVLNAGLSSTVDVVRLAEAVADVRAMLAGSGGTCVVVTAPPAIRDGLDLWGEVAGLALMRRLKEQFDPAGRFAAGRFVGGL
jgi:glycolate oxidase FAD binding subunit